MKEQIIFISDNGKHFTNKKECQDYEKNLLKITKPKKEELDEQLDSIFSTDGKHKGKTIREILKTDRDYLLAYAKFPGLFSKELIRHFTTTNTNG